MIETLAPPASFSELPLLPAAETSPAIADCQVRFYDEGALIRVPINAFGRTLFFVVDTGFTVSAIDRKYRQFLGRVVNTCVGRTPLGNDQSVPAFECPFLSLAGKPLDLEKILCLDLSMPALISGKPCDGILGLDFFENHVVSLNFDDHTFSVAESAAEIALESYLPIPLRRTEIYYLLAGRLNHGRPVQLMIDTGDTSSLSLNQTDWQNALAGEAAPTVATTVADTANQVAQSRVAVLRRLDVESLGYQHLHATLIRNPASPSDVGLGFFRRHNVIFDFARRRLYLQPGSRFSEPDREDRSGLHLLREGVTTFIYSVDEGSPAHESGARPRDTIESLNGRAAREMTMKAIRELLQSESAETVIVEIRRDRQVLELSILLNG